MGGLDTYVGNNVAKGLIAAGYEVLGTAENPSLAPDAASLVVRPLAHDTTSGSWNERYDHLTPLIDEAQLIVYNLMGREDEALSALSCAGRHTGRPNPAVFVGLSNAVAWGNTLSLDDVVPTPPVSCEPTPEPSMESKPTTSTSPDAEEGSEVVTREEHANGGSRSASKAGSAVNSQTGGEGEGEEGDDEASVPPSTPGTPDPQLTADMEPTRQSTVVAANVVAAERVVLRAHRPETLRTHVVCPGVVYGRGEDDHGFHGLFRRAFEHPDEPLPVGGSGANMLSVIHVDQLAPLLLRLVAHEESPRYVLAAEPRALTLADITAAISSAVASGQTRPATWTDFVVDAGVTHLLMHVPMAVTPLPPLPEDVAVLEAPTSFHTWAQGTALDEYLLERGLGPLRIQMLGAPATGKTTFGEAAHILYGVDVVGPSKVVAWSSTLQEDDPVAVAIAEELKGKPGRMSEALLARVTRAFLRQPQYRVKGWVLDGFPRSRKAAELLFASDEYLDYLDRVAEQAKKKGGKDEVKIKEVPYSFDSNLLPEHVFVLDSEESTLMHRIKMREAHEAALAAEAKSQGTPWTATHNNLKDFDRRKKAYLELRNQDKKHLDELVAAHNARVKEVTKDAKDAAAEARKAAELQKAQDPDLEVAEVDEDALVAEAVTSLGPVPEYGGLLALLAQATNQGAGLHFVAAQTDAPEPMPVKDPKAKQTAEDVEREALRWVQKDVESTGSRVVDVARACGIPRNYLGFPSVWDEAAPGAFLLAHEAAFSAPLGGRPLPPTPAVTAEPSTVVVASTKVRKNTHEAAWANAKRVVELERRAKLERDTLRQGSIRIHGQRLTSYLLEDVMPSITDAMLEIKDPSGAPPTDLLDSMATMVRSHANERVEENISPYDSPLYQLRKIVQG